MEPVVLPIADVLIAVGVMIDATTVPFVVNDLALVLAAVDIVFDSNALFVFIGFVEDVLLFVFSNEFILFSQETLLLLLKVDVLLKRHFQFEVLHIII